MKTCQSENCVNPVFGGGMCKWHQSKRTDGKKPKGMRYRTPQKEADNKLDFGYADQVSMFQDLWDAARELNGNVICPYTGENLIWFRDRKIWFSCFAHVLGKGRYPYFKLNPENVKVVFPEFHRIVDQGTHEDRAKHPDWEWDLWDSEVIRMKAEYAEFKRKNLLP